MPRAHDFTLSYACRVDVNKNESSNTQERMIVIGGQPDNCVQACREVLRIMYDDAQNKNKTK